MVRVRCSTVKATLWLVSVWDGFEFEGSNTPSAPADLYAAQGKIRV